MNRTPFTPMTKPPTRQGFYEVTLKDESVIIAEWKQTTKSEPKQWIRYVSEDPTQEKLPVVVRGVCGWRKTDRHTVAQALQRENTLAEKLESAYEQYKRHSDICFERMGLPPPSRLLSVGDAVELGHLRDCKVEAVHDDGQLLVISHRNITRKHGEDVDDGTVYRGAHWTQLIPRASIRKTDVVRSSIMHNGWFNTSLSELLSRVSYGLDDNPTYQRGYAWDAQDKAALLESLCSGREIGRFILVENNYPKLNEILDGKQRLNCIWDFFTSKLAYQGIFWHEMSPRDRHSIETRMVQIVELKSDKYTRADLLQIFLEVNAAGVPQTEAHLQKVRDELKAERAKEARAAK